MSNKLRIWVALLSIYLIWGSTYLGIRVAIETIPPFLMGGIRFLIAGSVLYLLRRARGDRTPTPLQWRAAAVVGLFLIGGGNGSVVWAEQRVPSGITALVIGMTPLWIVLFDWLRPGGRKPHPRALMGVLIGFAGILLLVGFKNIAGGGSIDPLGAAVILFGTLNWAVGSLYGRTAPVPRSPFLATGVEMLAGGAVLLLLGTVTGQWSSFDPSAISTRSLLALGYLIVFGSWIAFSAYVWLLRNAPTPLVATYAYVNPIVAIFLGSLLADEPLTPRVLLAAAIILTAVVLTTTARTSAPRPAPDEATASAE